MTMTLTGSGASAVLPGAVGTAGLANSAVTPEKTQVGALPSMVRVARANGIGSVGTAIRRFLNLVVSQGTDITYSDSATSGALFTINTSGVYSISYSDNFAATAWAGISLNASNLATSIYALADGEYVTSSYAGNINQGAACSVSLYLPAGSLVRPHNNVSAAAGSTTPACGFTITRVA